MPKKKIKQWGKGEEDLVKDNALMMQIDDLAMQDHDVSQVGGVAYVNEYEDKMSVSQVMNIQKQEKNAGDWLLSPRFFITGIVGLILVSAILVFIISKIIMLII